MSHCPSSKSLHLSFTVLLKFDGDEFVLGARIIPQKTSISSGAAGCCFLYSKRNAKHLLTLDSVGRSNLVVLIFMPVLSAWWVSDPAIFSTFSNDSNQLVGVMFRPELKSPCTGSVCSSRSGGSVFSKKYRLLFCSG